jgi:hypothetical protein
VYCLSADQRPRLKDAAVTLGLAQPDRVADQLIVAGRRLSLADWRTQRPSDFNRTCTALMAQRSPTASSASWATGLIATINVLVGALIGFWTARWRDIGLRSEQQGRMLYQAGVAFDAAARAYLRERQKTGPNMPSDMAVHDRRAELAAELRRVQALRPQWTIPKQLLSVLNDSLGDGLTQEWERQDVAGRSARAENLSAELNELADSIATVAHALERPFHRNLSMRKAIN